MFRKLARFVSALLVLSCAAAVCSARIGSKTLPMIFEPDSVHIAAADSALLASLDAKLDEYFAVLEVQDITVKVEECDFLISSTADSLLRQHVALRCYDHFLNSKVMGDEAVAIHLVDEWFASEKVKMADDVDLLNAKLYADFNRNTLLGCPAPRLTLSDSVGAPVRLPTVGRVSVLLFYDTGCVKCRMETILLKQVLRSGKYPLDFYAVYTGTDADAWQEFVARNYDYQTPSVTVYHLWDPELESDFQRLYGVLQTPRMFLIAPDGEIIGRGLDTEALVKLLPYAEVLQELYERCSVGETLPISDIYGELRTGKGVLHSGITSVKQLRGRNSYVLFYSKACRNCQEQLSKAEIILSSDRRAKILFVDMDTVLKDHQEIGKVYLDSFDLTILPMIVRIDRKGRVVSRGNVFENI